MPQDVAIHGEPRLERVKNGAATSRLVPGMGEGQEPGLCAAGHSLIIGRHSVITASD